MELDGLRLPDGEAETDADVEPLGLSLADGLGLTLAENDDEGLWLALGDGDSDADTDALTEALILPLGDWLALGLALSLALIELDGLWLLDGDGLTDAEMDELIEPLGDVLALGLAEGPSTFNRSSVDAQTNEWSTSRWSAGRRTISTMAPPSVSGAELGLALALTLLEIEALAEALGEALMLDDGDWLALGDAEILLDGVGDGLEIISARAMPIIAASSDVCVHPAVTSAVPIVL
jgi:hypothetical protein